jgi:hypothetical protein
LQSEDSLFDFFLHYFDVWSERSLSLFENIYFEYLSQSNLEKFFTIFSPFEIPPSVIQSLSFVFNSKSRIVHENRHSSKSNINSLSLLSLSLIQMQNKIENLRKQKKESTPGHPLSESTQLELFQHL